MDDNLDRTVINSACQRFKAQTATKERVMHEAIATGDIDALNRLDELPRYVNRFVQLGRPELAAELLNDITEGRATQASALERVIEQNELMAASFFARGLAASRAVGRVVVRDSAGQTRGYGTGFMISPQLMMTNNHVLNSEGSAGLSLIEFDFALGVDGKALVPQRFALDTTLFFDTSIPLDYTITGVVPVNAEQQAVQNRGWIHLIAESGKAIAGEPINIIQHPGGERQQIAVRENRIIGPDGDFLIYTTDTKQGSSGSPALNDQWQLAALHHAGVPDEDQAGNWLRKDGQKFREGVDDPATIKWIGNEGVRISRIVSAIRAKRLASNKRVLFEEAFMPAPLVNEGVGGGRQTAPPGQDGTPPNGMTIGSDGIARWNFQLTFGPMGQGPTPPTMTSAPPAAAPAPTTPVAARVTANDANTESVFNPLGPYFDQAANAEVVADYYAEIPDNLSKAMLFDALQTLVQTTHHTTLSYSKARYEHLYPWIDRREDEVLRSIYSGDEMAEELFVAELMAFETALAHEAATREATVSSLDVESIDAADLALENSSVFNCEHVVPQSWFEGADEQRAQKSDLHHLFTCASRCNSFRNNIPYFEFSEAQQTDLRKKEVNPAEALRDPTLEAIQERCGYREGRRFEPMSGKGAVARATLYFVLRYPGVVGDVKAGKKKEFVKSNIGLLLDWAQQDPVDRYEQHRNAEIAKVQGNRNPLIDHPEWLTQIEFERGFG